MLPSLTHLIHYLQQLITAERRVPKEPNNLQKESFVLVDHFGVLFVEIRDGYDNVGYGGAADGVFFGDLRDVEDVGVEGGEDEGVLGDEGDSTEVFDVDLAVLGADDWAEFGEVGELGEEEGGVEGFGGAEVDLGGEAVQVGEA